MRVKKQPPNLLLLDAFTGSLRSFRTGLTKIKQDGPSVSDNVVYADHMMWIAGYFLQHSKLMRLEKIHLLAEINKVYAEEIPRIERLIEELRALRPKLQIAFYKSKLIRIRNDIARGRARPRRTS
ncbi:MAG TPA: hypothetical protein VG102_01055 [Candidatus Paceibacterota bacterium]|jgi:hypothetical protein|nr:hypothetical protein [Candidatus Paceibacterota bacterium]